ncbi:MAG: hypothetical protein J5843_02400 [Clostridia bacterium]|nr:hypothetical protein [Clostridia bacterium]
MDSFERFDMNRKPKPCKWYLKPLLWALSFPSTWVHRTRIVKDPRLKGLKPPYLLLCNHNAFFDMKVALRACFPHVPNFVVAIDGFIGREGLLRSIGCICKRKFTNDMRLLKHIRTVIDNGGIPGIYPEARYSLCGTTAVLPESLGGMAKRLKIPVVTLICHGHHVNHPFWNTRKERGVKPTEAEMTLLLTPEELEKLPVDAINRKLVKAFQYDDFRWQKEKGVRVKDPDRAIGLEKILYQCPRCRSEFHMTSSRNELRCCSCGMSWRMDEYGQLSSLIPGEDARFPHIPDWYEWERKNVRAEVRSGLYTSGELSVFVRSLPNAKAFIDLGKGIMIHDSNGFRVRVPQPDGEEFTMEIPVPSLYSVHIEYEYLFKFGDCVDLNTLTDTWYVYPSGNSFSVTKLALATEELYAFDREKRGRPCPPGLA